MQKIVINSCYGGFGLSNQALELYKMLTGIPAAQDLSYWEIARDNPQLVQIVEQLGERADTSYSLLKVVEVPDDVNWHIHEHDGLEYVAENHRTWN